MIEFQTNDGGVIPLRDILFNTAYHQVHTNYQEYRGHKPPKESGFSVADLRAPSPAPQYKVG